MSDAQANTETQTQDATSTDGAAPERGMTAKEFNAAFSAREKAAEARLEKRFEALLAKLAPEEPKAETKEKPSESSEVQKLARQLQEMKAEHAKAKAEVLRNRLETEVRAHIQAHVSPEWLEEATEKLMRGATKDLSGFELDGLTYSAKEAAEMWLKDGANKKFLPVPKAKTGSHLPAARTATQTQKLSADEKAEALRNHFFGS